MLKFTSYLKPCLFISLISFLGFFQAEAQTSPKRPQLQTAKTSTLVVEGNAVKEDKPTALPSQDSFSANARKKVNGFINHWKKENPSVLILTQSKYDSLSDEDLQKVNSMQFIIVEEKLSLKDIETFEAKQSKK